MSRATLEGVDRPARVHSKYLVVLLLLLVGGSVRVSAISNATIMASGANSFDSGNCRSSTLGYHFTATGTSMDGSMGDSFVVRLLDGGGNIIASGGLTIPVGTSLDTGINIQVGTRIRSTDSVVPPQSVPFTFQIFESTSSAFPFTPSGGPLDSDTFDPATVNGVQSCAAALDVSAGAFNPTGPQGGPFSPTSRTYTLTNTGFTQALDFTVSDDATFVDLSMAGASLAAGAQVTVTASLNATVNSLAVGDYTGAISFTNTSNSVGDTTRPINLTVLGADLSVTKTDNATTAVAGESLTYIIVAANGAGGSDATMVSLTDTFPGALTCSWTSVAAGGATGNTSSAGAGLSESLTMPAGSTVTYTVTCTIDSAATGTLSNTVDISSPLADPDPNNNQATDTTTLTTEADLTISKTDNRTTAVPGEQLVYDIVATNVGPSDDPNVSLTDTFPGVLTCSWASVAIGGASGNSSSSGASLGDTLSMPANSTVTYTVTCDIDPAATGTLSNTASISGSVTDPTAANNDATDDDTVLTPTVDLTVTKDDGLTVTSPGAAITYVVTVSQSGPSIAAGATVGDVLPSELQNVTWTCVATTGSTCSASGSGDVSDTVTIDVGGLLTYTISGTVADLFVGMLTNTASASPASGVIDANPGDNSATDVTIATSASAITGTKTVTGSFVPGGLVTYTIVLTNAAPDAQLDDPASDELIDVLPAELIILDAMADSGVVDISGNTVTWNGVIAGNASVTIVIDAQIVRTGTAISNQADISFDADGDGSNETQSVTDDPDTPDPLDATIFIAQGPIAIPALSTYGLLLLALTIGVWGVRRLG